MEADQHLLGILHHLAGKESCLVHAPLPFGICGGEEKDEHVGLADALMNGLPPLLAAAEAIRIPCKKHFALAFVGVQIPSRKVDEAVSERFRPIAVLFLVTQKDSEFFHGSPRVERSVFS